MDLIEHMTSDEVLNLAYAWLCQRRKDSGPNADVWDVRWQWDELRPRVQALLRTGQYRFSPTRRAWLDGEPIEIWSAQDALVLKALAIVLGRALDGRLSQRCFHLTGRGGSKAAVRQTVAAAGENTFVFRSDVKSYYASIRHDILMQEAGRFVDDPIALDLIHQYADRMMCDGGVYVARWSTTHFQVLRFGETLIAKHQTLRPLSNSDSDVRDYSGGGMKCSVSSIVTFSVVGILQPDQTIHVRLSIWL